MIQSAVQFIRLQTGEDIITEISEVDNDDTKYYVFHNPMKIVYRISGKNGTLAVSLMQWVFSRICSEQDFIIYPDDVITMNKTTSDMEDYYWESVQHFTGKKEDLEDQTSFDKFDNVEDLLADLNDLLKTDKTKLH